MVYEIGYIFTIGYNVNVVVGYDDCGYIVKDNYGNIKRVTEWYITSISD